VPIEGSLANISVTFVSLSPPRNSVSILPCTCASKNLSIDLATTSHGEPAQKRAIPWKRRPISSVSLKEKLGKIKLLLTSDASLMYCIRIQMNANFRTYRD
jgi:hypothetical protein